MKKIGIILSLLIFAVSFSQAQDVLVERTLGSGSSVYDYQGQDTDVLSTDNDTIAYTMRVNKNAPVLHNIQVQTSPIGTVDGTITLDIKVYGRVFTTDSWTSIDATNTALDATVTQTINVFSDETAAIDTLAGNTSPFYRQFKVEITLATTTGLDAGEEIGLDHNYWKFYSR